MIHNLALTSIRTHREIRVADSLSLIRLVLVEDEERGDLAPGTHVHRVGADELELAETVVPALGARGRVDDERLACVGTCELFGAFAGREAAVGVAGVGPLLPGLMALAVVPSAMSTSWVPRIGVVIPIRNFFLGLIDDQQSSLFR